MKDLISEIQTMRNRMGLKTTFTPKILSEASIPNPLWQKLASYLDELILGGEKTFDDLAKKGVITNQELIWLKKNASEIAKRAKKITDPNVISDDILKKFKTITQKVTKDEIEKLSKRGFETWLEKNQDALDPINLLKEKLNKLEKEYLETGIISDKQIADYIINGGTWDELFKSTLEGNGYKGDLLDYALESFKKTDNIESKIIKVKGSGISNFISEKFPEFSNILKSGLGFFNASSAYKKALETTETLIKNFKVDDVSNSAKAKELIIKLKNDIKQSVTNDLPFNKVWEEIKERFPEYSDMLKKIETESGNDAFLSIEKLMSDVDVEIGKYKGKSNIDVKTKTLIENYESLKLKIKDWVNFKGLLEPPKLLIKYNNAIFVKLITFAFNVTFKSKVSRLLFWENVNSLKTILKKLSKGQLRDKGLLTNLFTTWFKLVFNSKMVIPFLIFANELVKSFDAEFIGIGKYNFEGKDAWDRTIDATLEEWFGPFIGDFQGFYNELMSGLNLVNPFGVGPTMELARLAIEKGWSVVKRTVTNDNENVAKNKNKEYENELNNIIAESVKNKQDTYVKVIQTKDVDFRSFTLQIDDSDYLQKNNLTQEQANELKSRIVVEPKKINILSSGQPTEIEQLKNKKQEIEKGEDPALFDYGIKADNGKIYKVGTEQRVDPNKPFYNPELNTDFMFRFIDDDGKKEGKPIVEFLKKIKKYNTQKESFMKDLLKKIILEEEGERTLKMKDWDEIFTFQKMDEKNPGKYTEVKLKMDSVMDRIPHWRKKYKKECEDMDNCDDDGEDDSFVRAVIDTHPEVVRILFTKGLAHLTSSEEQEDLNEGLHKLLAVIREAKSVEVEVWSVYRHPSSPDKIWSLVKGDYKPKELASMDVKMQQSPQNSIEPKKNSLDELKKKESEAIKILSTDEKKGLSELPIKVRNVVKEKIKRGWTTEKPSDKLINFFKKSEVESVLIDPIHIFKLKPTKEFFNFIVDNKTEDSIKRGFCRSIYYVKKEIDLEGKVMERIDDILDKCQNKFDGKYGQNYI